MHTPGTIEWDFISINILSQHHMLMSELGSDTYRFHCLLIHVWYTDVHGIVNIPMSPIGLYYIIHWYLLGINLGNKIKANQ